MSKTPQERVSRWLDVLEEAHGVTLGSTLADREVREAIRAVLAENALHKRWHRKPTHGACCTCQKCGLDYDTCRCSLDDVADELQQAEAERDEWRDIARAEGADEEHERALVSERDALRAEVERLREQFICTADPAANRIKALEAELARWEEMIAAWKSSPPEMKSLRDSAPREDE
jgi:hypothetical protein